MYSAQLAVVVLLISTASALYSHQLEQSLNPYMVHSNYIDSFPCLHPQFQVISVHKLVSSSETHGKSYEPGRTVLFRCQECTGFCHPGKTCAVKKYNLVTLPFKATYLQDMDRYSKGDWTMEYHTSLNHTECECVDKQSLLPSRPTNP